MKWMGWPVLRLAACLAMTGCIENPGPDSRLDRDAKNPYEVPATAVFRNTEALFFRIREDSGEVLLRVTSQAAAGIDSAGYVLQLCAFHSFTDFGRPVLCTQTELEWTGSIGRIAPGQTLELGPIDFDPSYQLQDITLIASVLRISESGTSYSHPMNGLYRGAYAAVDSSGNTFPGPANGIINSDGSFSFLLVSSAGLGQRGILKGDLRDDGSLQGGVVAYNFNLLQSPVKPPAAFVPWGLGLRALLVSTGPGIPPDTLDLAVERYAPD